MDFQPAPRRRLNKRLARMRPVQSEVHQVANRIASRAAGRLGAHRDTGNARITVEHAGVDSLVSLEDPGGNALSIEFGHTDKKTGRAVPGIYVLTNSI